MTASRARELAGPTETTVSKLTVPTPPTACPCVVRVSSQGDDEIAIAPITIVGHPVAPVVEPSSFENPLVVSIAARPVSAGLSKGVRSSLGGATTYEVTVTVRNKSTADVGRVVVAGSAGRGADDDLVDLTLGAPRALGAGQTWQQVVTVELPAPVYGDYEWRAVASGVGTSVTATTETSHTPILFWILVVFLAVDLLVLVVRFVRKRVRRPGRAARPGTNGDIDHAATDRVELDEREPEFV